MVRYVYDFTEGGRDLVRPARRQGREPRRDDPAGLPVPPGFIVSTEACRAFLATGAEPEGMSQEVSRRLSAIESDAGRRLGQPDDPLLVSVRSGARFSMPGMMETVLDIGLNDDSVLGLAKASGNERFAWDSYRRLIQMYGSTVMGVDGALFDRMMTRLKELRGTPDDLHLDAADLAELVEAYKRLIHEETGDYFPQSPAEQLRRAILGVFRSWNGERARLYRRREHIPDDLGTAVTVQRMVYGNLGRDSGSGVAFTRDPATGRSGLYGDYLPNAQGEDVAAGLRDTVPLAELEQLDPRSYRQLRDHMGALERHYRDLCDFEFTIERGRLWMLQPRVGKRTAEAAFTIAAELADEGLITPREGLARVNGDGLARLMFPRFDTSTTGDPLAHGIPASPGAAVGAAVFDSAEAVRRAASGEKVVLVREETTPDDLPGMVAAGAVLTSRGGKTSHAAVVARGVDKVCVCGAEELSVDTTGRRFTTHDGTVVEQGSVISVDGSAGAVYAGAVPLVDSAVMRFLETSEGSARVADAVAGALQLADEVRRLEVRANADTPKDAARARRFGAQGIGLCRTEHMFLGERRKLVEEMILARDDAVRDRALDTLLPLQRQDFVGILEAMDGLPVTIRLLDPPLHEFLPDRTDLAVRIAATQARGEQPNATPSCSPPCGARTRTTRCSVCAEDASAWWSPGWSPCRGEPSPKRSCERTRAEGSPEAEIMVPLVGDVTELRLVRGEVEQVLSDSAGSGTGSSRRASSRVSSPVRPRCTRSRVPAMAPRWMPSRVVPP